MQTKTDISTDKNDKLKSISLIFLTCITPLFYILGRECFQDTNETQFQDICDESEDVGHSYNLQTQDNLENDSMCTINWYRYIDINACR